MIYISGCYTNGDSITKKEKDKNVNLAKKYAIKIWNMGVSVICPHLNTRDFEEEPQFYLTHSDVLQLNLRQLDRVDALFMLENWKKSKGARVEHHYAEISYIPIFYTLDDLMLFIMGCNRNSQWIKTHEIHKCAVCKLYRTNCVTIEGQRVCHNCKYGVHQILVKCERRLKEKS
jgi:hypothetical protein